MKFFVVACVSLASAVHADVTGTSGGVFVTSDMPAGCADSACMVGHPMEVDPTALAECIAASVWGCKITHTTATRAQYCTARSSKQIRVLVPSTTTSGHFSVSGLAGCAVAHEEYVELASAIDFGQTNDCVGARIQSPRATAFRSVRDGSLDVNLSLTPIPASVHRPLYVVTLRDEFPGSCNLSNPSFSVGPIYKAETTVYGTATGFLVTAPPTLEACVSDVCRDQLVTEADLERCRLATPKDCTYAVPTNYYYPNCATADKKEFQLKMPAAEHGNSLAQTFLTAKINIIGGTCTALASETVSSVFNPANGECSAPLEGDAVALATFATNHVTVNFENVTEVLLNPVYAAKLTCSAAPTGLEPDRAGLSVISHFVGASAGVLSNVSVGFVSIVVALLYASQY